ncbi:NB-ARC domain-containing protein [Saccharothrix sp.]|uniref:NB-ARC domain-containing protein n=1 Tax=Saccharothrix sp. TaxID=1873460 RepID=UPI0028125173|nr:NB-ARC domain-containing protein [Saccharothrix sp.]
MGGGRRSGDPRAEFAAAVAGLRGRLPDLTDEALARRAGAVVLPSGRRVAVNARRLGEWVSGRSVPRDFDAVLAVALATGGTGQVARLRELWRAASRERRPAVDRAGVDAAGAAQGGAARAGVAAAGAARAGVARVVVGRPPRVAAAFRDRSALVEVALGECHRVVLTGAGGVGKSQLAAAAFRRARGEVLVWVSAASRQSVLSGYARAWRALGNAGNSDEEAADRFLEWLRSSSSPWLVVLDDLDDPAELSGLWPEGSGRTLVTTRRRDAALLRPDVRVVQVGVFTPEEATGYLVERLSVDPRHGRSELVELGAALGWQPLALAQAAAFLIDTGLGVPAYLDRLADRRQRVADLFPASSPGDEHDGTVAATVARSVERARSLSPDAPVMLEAVSLLAPEGIPEDVLLHGRDLLALRALHRLNLVTHADGRVEVHPLVQRVVRDLVVVSPAVEVADSLEAVWVGASADVAVDLFRCAEALVEVAGEHLWEVGHPLLRRLPRRRLDIGRSAAA